MGAGREQAAHRLDVARRAGLPERGVSAHGRAPARGPSPDRRPRRRCPAMASGSHERDREQQEQDADRRDAEQVGLDLLVAAQRDAGRGPTRRPAAPAPRRWRRTGTRAASATRASPTPAAWPRRKTSSGAQAPWRRSSSQPNRNTAPSAHDLVGGAQVGEAREHVVQPAALEHGDLADAIDDGRPDDDGQDDRAEHEGEGRDGAALGRARPASRPAAGGSATGGRRRWLGAASATPPLSSFGARLRSRLPQYGHSVM